MLGKVTDQGLKIGSPIQKTTTTTPEELDADLLGIYGNKLTGTVGSTHPMKPSFIDPLQQIIITDPPVIITDPPIVTKPPIFVTPPTLPPTPGPKPVPPPKPDKKQLFQEIMRFTDLMLKGLKSSFIMDLTPLLLKKLSEYTNLPISKLNTQAVYDFFKARGKDVDGIKGIDGRDLIQIYRQASKPNPKPKPEPFPKPNPKPRPKPLPIPIPGPLPPGIDPDEGSTEAIRPFW